MRHRGSGSTGRAAEALGRGSRGEGESGTRGRGTGAAGSGRRRAAGSERGARRIAGSERENRKRCGEISAECLVKAPPKFKSTCAIHVEKRRQDDRRGSK